jgi:hypothetical protein
MVLKLAVTDLLAVIETVQVPVPEQPSPDQPVKVEPPEAVAVRLTDVPELKLAEQVAPQSMPLGLLVTVPEPVPVLETERV